MSSSAPKESGQPHPKRSLSDIVERFIKSVPAEEFDKLPSDGSVQLDHYIYGWPKRPS